jgi:hypothetical protein
MLNPQVTVGPGRPRLAPVGAAPTPDAGSDEPARLTITYSENDDGWITAQVVEYPAAISQGATQHEAWVNLLDALHDLTHTPTLAEHVAFTVDAWLGELGERAAELGEGLRDRFIAGAADRGRAALERGRGTGVR